MEAEAHGYSVGEEREFNEIGIFDVRYLRCVVLVWTHINVGSLVGGEGGVFLGAVDLSEKSVRVIAIKMKERESCSATANIELGRAIVQPRAEEEKQRRETSYTVLSRQTTASGGGSCLWFDSR